MFRILKLKSFIKGKIVKNKFYDNMNITIVRHFINILLGLAGQGVG